MSLILLKAELDKVKAERDRFEQTINNKRSTLNNYHREYYANNKERLRPYFKEVMQRRAIEVEYINCDCGRRIKGSSLKTHLLTEIHTRELARQQNA